MVGSETARHRGRAEGGRTAYPAVPGRPSLQPLVFSPGGGECGCGIEQENAEVSGPSIRKSIASSGAASCNHHFQRGGNRVLAGDFHAW